MDQLVLLKMQLYYFLPQIMKRAKKYLGVNEEIVILTATSGDTGKAALEGFKV